MRIGEKDETREKTLRGILLPHLQHFTVLNYHSKANKAALQGPHNPPKAYGVVKVEFQQVYSFKGRIVSRL